MSNPIEHAKIESKLCSCGRELTIRTLTVQGEEVRTIENGEFRQGGIIRCNCGHWHHIQGFTQREEELNEVIETPVSCVRSFKGAGGF